MVTMVAPLSSPRRDPTARDALRNVERDAGRGRLAVPILDWALAKYDERPCVDRAAVLAVMERAYHAGR
jgi:hypothetical protein